MKDSFTITTKICDSKMHIFLSSLQRHCNNRIIVYGETDVSMTYTRSKGAQRICTLPYLYTDALTSVSFTFMGTYKTREI